MIHLIGCCFFSYRNILLNLLLSPSNIMVIIIPKIVKIKVLTDIIITILPIILIVFLKQLALREHILVKFTMSFKFFHTQFKLLFVLKRCLSIHFTAF